jgi:hypothetical protein
VDHYINKCEEAGDLPRQFYGFTQSWKDFIDHSEDAKLFLSLLQDGRNTRETIKHFIKIRKTILKTTNVKILEEVAVTHSTHRSIKGDSITISLLLFEGPHRNTVIKKVNDLFISLKQKLINTAKYI